MRTTAIGECTPPIGRTWGMRRPVRRITLPSISSRRMALGDPTSPGVSGVIVAALRPRPVSRMALAASRHVAISCDLLPTDVAGPHIQGDVLELIGTGYFDLMVAHPPCTYLANSGVQYLHKDTTRFDKMVLGREFFLALLNAPIYKICVENPV